MYEGQRLIADDGYEVALYPMTSAEITQSPYGSYSHRCSGIANTGLWDVIGHTGATDQSAIYAPFSGTITVSQASGHQRVLSSSDKVHLANGTLDYANFGWGHDNDILVDRGATVTQGELIGHTGTYPNVPKHSHFMLGTGYWSYGNYLPTCLSLSYGTIFYMPNAIDIDNMFYVNNTDVYTYTIDGWTLNWRTWEGPIVEYVTIGTSVYPENSGIVTGGGTVIKGSSVTLTAIPNESYIFNKWNNGSTDNPLIITASESANYVAYMRKRKQNIILMLNYDGTGVQIR